MLRRVNPIVLLSITLVLVLSLAILAGAQGGGGTAGEALAAAEGQVGKPFVMATDGPDTFSCVGLMRYALRTAGVDPDAPWSPEAYLGKYAPVDPANLQPGDIVIYPGWATMYAGNGRVVNANEMEGVVTHTSMDVAGTPLGIVRPPYGGSSQPAAVEPNADQPMNADPAAVDPATPGLMVTEEQTPVDPAAFDPTAVDPAAVDLAAVDHMMAAEPAVVDPLLAADPAMAVDPAAQF